MASCTYIDGIGSSQAIDTAGEVVDLKGLDCSSLQGAHLNWEHNSNLPAQVVGKILDFKKIFSEKDCENERHHHYWKKIGIPFLYIIGRLLDDKKQSSREVAALFLDDAEHPGEKPMVGFSVEGSKIPGAKEGMILTRSIARKVTITGTPANKTCVAEMIASPHAPKDELDSIFKAESTHVQFFNPNSKYLEFLEKKEETMNKQEKLEDLTKALPPNWKPSMTQHSQLGSIASLSHPQHGVVTIHKNPETGNHEVKHAGTHAGLMGQKGIFTNAKDAMAHASAYVSAIHTGKVLPRTQVNMPSSDSLPSASNIKKPPKLAKALEAGSGLSAPGDKTQGEALAKEDLLNKPLFNKVPGSQTTPGLKSGMGMSHMGQKVRHGAVSETVSTAKDVAHKNLKRLRSEKKPKLDKSEWLSRAEDAYARWEKREEFRNFMKKSMPNMAKGEIDAIGQVIALKKSLEDEETLEKMFSSYFIKEENQE